jgi:hypothetical protein
MSTDIYDGFGYNYAEELQKESKDFVPLGSKKSNPNSIRFSPIAVKSEKSKMGKLPLPVQSRRANASPSTMTAMYGIRGTSPIITYDRDLGRPFSPIEVNKSLSLGRASNNIFKPIAQRPAQTEPSTATNRGSPTTYMEYKRSLGTDVKEDDDDWGFHDRRFKGGKKRTRKARNTRSRSVRSERRKRTKRSYSRRRRSRKIR